MNVYEQRMEDFARAKHKPMSCDLHTDYAKRCDDMNPIVKLLQDILAQIKLLRKDLKK